MDFLKQDILLVVLIASLEACQLIGLGFAQLVHLFLKFVLDSSVEVQMLRLGGFKWARLLAIFSLFEVLKQDLQLIIPLLIVALNLLLFDLVVGFTHLGQL